MEWGARATRLLQMCGSSPDQETTTNNLLKLNFKLKDYSFCLFFNRDSKCQQSDLQKTGIVICDNLQITQVI